MASLTKIGTGELILSGTDTYKGGTTVDAGTLAIKTASALPDGTKLTVAAGGTFIFDPALAEPVVGSAVTAGVAAVPEPGTLALLAAGGVVLLPGRRKKKGSRISTSSVSSAI